MLELPGFEIRELLFQSQTSVVYRGQRRSDGAGVVLKTLQGDYPSSSRQERLHHDYEIRRLLNFEGIVRAVEVLSAERGPVLVLEDFPGRSLDELIHAARSDAQTENPSAKTETIEAFLKIAIRLAAILGQIHARGVIHKDIKPANILVHPASQEVKITDFGIAARLTRERPRPWQAGQLEGTLAFMSPEQTGRMNQSLDYRSDLYSLGATLYALFAGRPPFIEDDPSALLYCHIAREAVPLIELRPEIPESLADIVGKLLNKDPEHRYLSAAGLGADLEECLRLFQTGSRNVFVLGRQDVSEHFQLSRKLYGREEELEGLKAAWRESAWTGARLLLISGAAGIGKTALVRELENDIARRGGGFVAGKFDQGERDVPYSSFLQALRELVRQILTGSPESLFEWKTKINAALTPNARVLTDVLPELEWIIGLPPAVQELAPFEARNRFQLVLGKFLRLFAENDRSLVLFLDDLQWADPSSLQLLRAMLADLADCHILFIAAYRDDPASDPSLEEFLRTVREQNTRVRELKLNALNKLELNDFVADEFGRQANARRVVDVLQSKTMGNPYYVRAFLASLHEQGALHKTPGGWRIDAGAMSRVRGTENVMELMAGRIRKLPAETRRLLEYAACLGGVFGLDTLALVSGRNTSEVSRELWSALEEGLIVETAAATFAARTVYEFVHDRVQQAAYSLIPLKRRQHRHRRIGGMLREQEHEYSVFDVVGHLNSGTLEDTGERIELARLNAEAGERATASSAFDTALRYFRNGLELLHDGDREQSYELVFQLRFRAFECEQQTGDLTGMNASFAELMRMARSKMEKARVLHVRMLNYTLSASYPEAVDTALEALRLLDVKIDRTPSAARVALALLKVKSRLFFLGAGRLDTLPEMRDPLQILRVRILIDMTGPAYQSDQNLFGLCLLNMIGLTLRYGMTRWTTMGLGLYGVLEGVLGNLGRTYHLSDLGLSLAARYDSLIMVGRTSYLHAIWGSGWRLPIARSLSLINDAYRAALDSGDIYTAAYAADNPPLLMIMAGHALDEIQTETSRYLEFVRRVEYEEGPDFLLPYQQFIRSLKGQTRAPGDYTDEGYDEAAHRAQLREKSNALPYSFYCFTKLMALYLAGDFRGALEVAAESRAVIDVSTCLIYISIHYFFEGLTAAALYQDSAGKERRQLRRLLKGNRRRLKRWSAGCPENFEHQYLLLSAELAAVQNRTAAARSYYERAIRAAGRNNFHHHQAICYERAAEFFFAARETEVGTFFLRQAMNGFQRWGARAVVLRLKRRLETVRSGGLLEGAVRPGPAASLPTLDTTALLPFENLDLETLVKAGEAITGALVLEELLERLLTIAMENAGARRGYFIREGESKLFVEAHARTVPGQTGELLEVNTRREALSDLTAELAVSIVHFVAHSRETVLLRDGRVEDRFQEDPRLQSEQVRSLLCVPILHQGSLNGILYLENDLSPGAFDPDRLQLLQMLSTQSAIAIENAVLYQNLESARENLEDFNQQLEESNRTLEERVLRRTLQLEQALAKENELSHKLRKALEREQELVELKSSFITLVSHEYRNPLAAISSAAFMLKRYNDRLSREDQIKKIERIEADVLRMTSLLEDVLTVGRDVRPEYVQIDLGKFCRDLSDEITSAFPDREIVFKGIEPSRIVLLDRNLLHQILSNLISNGLKYSPRSRPVEVEFSESAQRIEFSVRDWGIGIVPEDQANLFEPFHRGRNVGELPGYGLGLSIVKRAVDLLNGEMELWSNPEEGTQFRVRLSSGETG